MEFLFIGIGAGFVLGFFVCDHFRDKREAAKKPIFKEIHNEFYERN